MSNLGVLFRVFLLSSFLAAATCAPNLSNLSDTHEIHIGHVQHVVHVTEVSNSSVNTTNLQGIECDSCQFVTHKIDDYVFHNEKVMGFAKDEFDNICNLLPDDAKNICYATVNQTLPSILASIGDFIATNGCQEIGICPHP
jgi:hypothetical protein